MGYADAENDVLRDRLRNAKDAGFRIRELMKQTRMNPEIREKITDELLWITSPVAASRRREHDLRQKQQQLENNQI